MIIKKGEKVICSNGHECMEVIRDIDTAESGVCACDFKGLGNYPNPATGGFMSLCAECGEYVGGVVIALGNKHR